MHSFFKLFASCLLVLLVAGCTGTTTTYEAPTLESIDQVVQQGPYSEDWSTMQNYPVPEWYQDAKFGIFIHWGVYSVPAFASEHYPRMMYEDKDSWRGNPFQYHLKTFGPHKTFGYKDFIPMFKAEKFDPAAWADLFVESGAKYVVPVAEHHDGFPMYDCSYSQWDAVDMGPKRDIVTELEKTCRERGLYFGVSSHRANLWRYFAYDESFDTTDPANADFYWEPHDKNDPPTKEYKDDWLLRTAEMVDKFKPDLVWFDFGIRMDGFDPYNSRFASYYYNRAKEWGMDVAINYKNDYYPEGTAVLDLERGKLEGIRKMLWQTDTSVCTRSWGYVNNHDYKSVDSLVDDFVDIVSKNGLMLLNIGPRPDGTIPDEQQKILREMGQWLKVNGEAIYGAGYWKVYGEGPTEGLTGHMSERKRAKDGTVSAVGDSFVADDIRFTTQGNDVYAITLGWKDTQWNIASLGKSSQHMDGKTITGVSLVGSDENITWEQTGDALVIQAPSQKPCDHAFAFKVTVQ